MHVPLEKKKNKILETASNVKIFEVNCLLRESSYIASGVS